MYTPPYFQIKDRSLLFSTMREFSFATLISSQASGMVASHLPLLIADDGTEGRILGHMARANTQWQGFDGKAEALAIFQGSHGYVSPSWYTVHPAVPTWNYIVVHAYGAPIIVEEQDAILDILRQTVDKYEGGREQPWAMADLPSDYLEKMVRGIVAFEMPIVRIEGKAKLSQNRSHEDQALVIEALCQSESHEDRELSKLMRVVGDMAEDTVQ
jgi:transcriptional regulator